MSLGFLTTFSHSLCTSENIITAHQLREGCVGCCKCAVGMRVSRILGARDSTLFSTDGLIAALCSRGAVSTFLVELLWEALLLQHMAVLIQAVHSGTTIHEHFSCSHLTGRFFPSSPTWDEFHVG